MLTAICAGLFLSITGIYLYNNNYFIGKTVNFDNNALFEESEENPSSISRLTDSIISSNNENFEIRNLPLDYKAQESKKNISAKSYIVVDITNNKVILKKDESRLFPIASITKLVTAITARRLMDQNKSITLSSNILTTYGNEGKFRLNEKMKINELLFPLLMVSSNDASEAIAGAYSLGRKGFIKEMNNWSNEIGAYKTYFRDPSGLSPQNLSTVEDLITIINWILKNDSEILDITLEKSKSIRMHNWNNPTHFLNISSYIGGKNGYTTEANRTSVSLFKLGKDKRIFAIVILNSSRRDSDILNLLDEAIR